MSDLFNPISNRELTLLKKIMKPILLLCALCVCVELCAQKDLTNTEWLVGKWTRTNSRPGRSGFEVWERISPTELKGMGINLKGADTTFIEKLKIVVKNSELFYVADVPENKEPVFFKLTGSATNSLTFENPQHDFPRKIVYELAEGKLRATISGDGKSNEFWFEKK